MPCDLRQKVARHASLSTWRRDCRDRVTSACCQQRTKGKTVEELFTHPSPQVCSPAGASTQPLWCPPLAVGRAAQVCPTAEGSSTAHGFLCWWLC
eukprot:1149127-Pelagomonas_calceolata.AAC.5